VGGEMSRERVEVHNLTKSCNEALILAVSAIVWFGLRCRLGSLTSGEVG